jgi:hypothetical protein
MVRTCQAYLCQSLLHRESDIDSVSERIGSESGFERIGNAYYAWKAPTNAIHQSISETGMDVPTAIFVPDPSTNFPLASLIQTVLGQTPTMPRTPSILISGFETAMSLLRSMPILKAADELTIFGLRSGLECLPFSKPKDGSTPKA